MLNHRILALFALCVCSLATIQTAFGQGMYVTGVGPVNRSMAGAGTAAPLDALGAVTWNPASISGMADSELGFGYEFLFADVDLSSNAGPDTEGEAGVVGVPSVGWVHHVDDTPITIGLGLAGVAGFKNIQPAGNAILGGNPASASAEFLQITPTISYAVTERLSLGFAPTVTLGEIGFDPLGPSVITPGSAQGQGNQTHWGMGFQVGAYYLLNEDVHLGVMFRSTQWMEEFKFYTPPSASIPDGVVEFDLDLPMILSIGTAYTGFEDWTFAADFRYFGYDDADGFSDLGWSNLFAAAFGVQKKMSNRINLRGGVNFNQPAIHSSDMQTNVVTPLIQKYNLTGGGSYRLSRNVSLNAAYAYLGSNSVSGPVVTPLGTFTVTNDVQAHSAIIGVSARY